MAFFEYIYERPARRHYKGWRSWATRCRLKPIVDKARIIHRRFEISSPVSGTALPTQPASPSIQRFSGSPLAVFAARRTSLQPYTSIAVASILCRLPTKFPECPHFLAHLQPEALFEQSLKHQLLCVPCRIRREFGRNVEPVHLKPARPAARRAEAAKPGLDAGTFRLEWTSAISKRGAVSGDWPSRAQIASPIDYRR